MKNKSKRFKALFGKVAILFLLSMQVDPTAFAASTQLTVFATNFNSGAPPEFSGVTTTEGVQGYLGIGTGLNVFGGDFLRNATTGNPASKTILTLTGLPPHTSIDVNFLLAIIDSWDGGTGNASPDFFNVTVDGNLIFSESLTNISAEHWASYPDATTPAAVVLVQEANLGFTNQTGSDCSPWFCDSAYDMGMEPTFHNIPHTSATLMIEWFATGGGWQSGGWPGDESWAIDNVEVVVNGTTITPPKEMAANICTAIRSFPASAFKNNPPQRIDAFCEKIDEVISLIEYAEMSTDSVVRDQFYQEAIDKLQNDIGAKMDSHAGGEKNNDWITDENVQAPVYQDIQQLIKELHDMQ